MKWTVAFRGVRMKDSRSLSLWGHEHIKAASWQEDGRQEKAPDRWSKALRSLFFRWNDGDEMLCFLARGESDEMERRGSRCVCWGLWWDSIGEMREMGMGFFRRRNTHNMTAADKRTRSYKLITSKSNVTLVQSQTYECHFYGVLSCEMQAIC